MEGHEVEK